MKWKVRLNGEDTGLEDLIESFNDDPEIFENNDKYFIWSSEFEDLSDPSEVRGSAEEIVQYIRNFGSRDSLWVNDLEVSHVHRVHEDGTEHIHVLAEAATVRMRAGPVRVTSSSENRNEKVCLPADKTEEWTRLALKDEKVSKLVKLLDRGDSWVNFYRIYEFIQDDIKSDDNIIDQGWWSGRQKNRFKQTANSRDAIGDDARHGQDQIPAPSDPMSHSEAKRLVNTLINHWLHHRKEYSN